MIKTLCPPRLHDWLIQFLNLQIATGTCVGWHDHPTAPPPSRHAHLTRPSLFSFDRHCPRSSGHSAVAIQMPDAWRISMHTRSFCVCNKHASNAFSLFTHHRTCVDCITSMRTRSVVSICVHRGCCCRLLGGGWTQGFSRGDGRLAFHGL
jgi:hypothetical protein